MSRVSIGPSDALQSYPSELDSTTFKLDWTDALGAMNGAYDETGLWMLQQLLARIRRVAGRALADHIAALEAQAGGAAALPAPPDVNDQTLAPVRQVLCMPQPAPRAILH